MSRTLDRRTLLKHLAARAGTAAWGSGNEDTVLATGNGITRVVVRWPTADALGFDPDAMFHGIHHGMEMHLHG